MQSENRFFDDISRMASGAMGALAGVRTEIEGMVRQRVERMAADMNLVPRDEFDAVKEMAATARAEQEQLSVKLAALEARVALLEAQGHGGTEASAAPKPKRAPRPPQAD